MLRELIEFVHIYVHEKLRGQITERQSFSRSRAREASDDAGEELEHVLIRDSLLQDIYQDAVVYGRKEFANIALKDVAGAGIVLRYLVRECLEPPHRPMRSFVEPTGIRIGYEGAVEEGVELAVNGVVEEPVANRRFVNVSGLRIRDLEGIIAAMSIRPTSKILVKSDDIGHQITPKKLDIRKALLTTLELLPSVK
jgi:hypothetical protein